ncbi:hypothetical protein HGD77_08835 [Acinetobacter sp. NEB149]|uniref:hypothetical protein n=1 Tax=Acinetobacter sp. NEB149 TaxID=2725684 RepID=UPI001449E5DE|nr:hypothetical protein [Acinetobacter sp. NEB149]QJB48805.1 hypothetical protein HGD77_08835 [Acinetobacter sp. NEB149]
MIDEEKPLNFDNDSEPQDFEDEEFIDDKKEDEMYNAITKDGSSVDPADDGTRHIRPEDGDPIEVEVNRTGFVGDFFI